MVESVRAPSSTSSNQPQANKPAGCGLTIGKCCEFKQFMTPQIEPRPKLGLALSASEPMAEQGSQRHHLARASKDPPEALAPDSEAGGGGRPEPAEWLASFNLTGGADAALCPLPAPPSAAPLGMPDVADLVERWVRRVALGGDSQRGVARLDIGSGRLAGAELVVTAEPGHVSVELSLPAGHNDQGLSARLRQRLEQRGFHTDVVVR